jgi:hypothetical protein
MGRQAADLTRRPEVVRLRERGKDLAVEQAQTVKQKVVARSKDTASSARPDATNPAMAGPRRGLRTSRWRPRFSRSKTTHFPPSQDVTPPAALGGTTVMEDSEAAMLGTPVMPRPESPAPPTDHR